MSEPEVPAPGHQPAWRRAAARIFPEHRRALLAAALGIALALLDSQAYLLGARLDERAFDAQVALVRALRPAAVAPPADVVLVGVDEASLDGLAVPLSLLHATLGTALSAIASAQPRAIGLDIALPERSFDRMLPGLDAGLMEGLQAARAAAPLAVALDTNADGRVRVPYAPLLAIAGGAGAFGLPLFPIDCDGVVRRFEPDAGRAGSAAGAHCGPAAGRAAISGHAMPTFAGCLAAQLGRPSALAEGGWIDFTRGASFDYVSLQEVIGWQRTAARDPLLAHFRGQVVLVGSVLPYIDRLRLPAALTRWEDAVVPPPGLIANAQVLRNALGGGLVRRPPALFLWLALGGFAAAALPARAGARYLLLAAALALAFVGGALLHAAGWFVAPGAAIVAGVSAVTFRTGLDLASAHRQRERLVRNFGGYLSPALLRILLEDTRDDARARLGVRRPIALLFADLQDFTRRTEQSDPEQIRSVLNRYYAAITPGLHAHGGVIDNFRGDGIMVMFGALEELDRPCDAALAAAYQLLEQIERLNREELAPRGIAPVGVTMGLAYGDVVYGEVGSPDRRDFTALGDAVNVAAHLQGVAKQVGYPLVMTAVFAANLESAGDGLTDLGEVVLKGHSPLHLYAGSPRTVPVSPSGTSLSG